VSEKGLCVAKWLSSKPLDLNYLAAEVTGMNRNWWLDVNTGKPVERNKAELLCLVHSEISECLEGVRKDVMDDKLPHRPYEVVELADALIRILDYAGGFGLDLQGAFEEKMAYNALRVDHTHEHRRATGGKKF
jgi:NTP pyrophosphatase (non-canonical NTP hydrolase)